MFSPIDEANAALKRAARKQNRKDIKAMIYLSLIFTITFGVIPATLNYFLNK
jgi:hypothetical protein